MKSTPIFTLSSLVAVAIAAACSTQSVDHAASPKAAERSSPTSHLACDTPQRPRDPSAFPAPVDPRYRASAEEKRALKDRAGEAAAPASITPAVRPEVLEAQRAFLAEAERQRTVGGRDDASREAARAALKARMLGAR